MCFHCAFVQASFQSQLEAAVTEAIAATQARLRSAVDQRDGALRAAEMDVAELRAALAGRDEKLVELEAALMASQQAVAAASSATAAGGAAAAGGATADSGDVQRLQQEVDSLSAALAGAQSQVSDWGHLLS